MEARTIGEVQVYIEGEFKNVNQKFDTMEVNFERLINALSSLETVRLAGVEARVTKVEKFVNQWGGALVAFNVVVAIVGILLAIFK